LIGADCAAVVSETNITKEQLILHIKNYIYTYVIVYLFTCILKEFMNVHTLLPPNTIGEDGSAVVSETNVNDIRQDIPPLYDDDDSTVKR
jgi:hypothetical protein